MAEVVPEVLSDVSPETSATLSERFSALLSIVDEQAKSYTNFMKSVNVELKSLQKEVNKLQPKKKTKKANVDGVKKNNVFDKPVEISEELCTFLNLEKGKQYSRQFITNSLFDYVKTNELQNPENRRFILLDSTDEGKKLNELLKPDQPLTFFNMQRYLKPHYPKTGTKVEEDLETESPVVEEKPKKSNRKKASDVEKSPSVVPDVDVVSDVDVVVEDESPLEPKKKTRRAVTRKA